MALSKALNLHLLQECWTAMTDPVKQHISLHLPGACDNETFLFYLNINSELCKEEILE